MQAYIDLHTHSTYSDGTYTPEELVLVAKQKGLCALALTDHDTIEGLSQFQAAGVQYGMETINGIEFATKYQRFHQPELHIVGLGFDANHVSIQSRMVQIQKDRHRRNIEMAERLTVHGLPVSIEEVTACAGGTIITRAHFAQVLLKKKLCSSKQEIFSKYLSTGCSCYVERSVFTPQTCIDTIHNAGGIAILAHPTLYQLDDLQLSVLCQSLKHMGLDGMECYYSTYTAHQTNHMLRLAKKYELLISGGSDFHGAHKPEIQIGTGTGNLKIPYILWETMKKNQQTTNI